MMNLRGGSLRSVTDCGNPTPLPELLRGIIVKNNHQSLRGVAVLGAALLATGTLGACSGDSDKASAGAKDAKIEVIVPRAAAYWTSVVCGVKEVAEDEGADVQVQTGKEYTATDQIPLLNASLARNPDGLVIVPADSNGMVAPLRLAKQDGVTIATAGIGLVEDKASDAVDSSVITDDYAGGEQAAEALAAAIGEKGTVLVMGTVPGMQSTDDRIEGTLEGLKAYPDIEVLPVEFNKSEVNTAASIVSSTLAAHPDLAGIVANNLVGVNGAVTGLRQEKKNGTVKVAGFDADPAEIEAMRAGDVHALVVADPKQLGIDAAKQVFAALAGESVEASVKIANTLVTSENLDAEEVKPLLEGATC